MLYKKYLFGDTAAYYVQTEEFGAGLMLFPADVEIGDADALSPDCMVQCVLRGAQNLVDYTNGITLRNRSSARLATDALIVPEPPMIRICIRKTSSATKKGRSENRPCAQAARHFSSMV